MVVLAFLKKVEMSENCSEILDQWEKKYAAFSLKKGKISVDVLGQK